MSDQRFSLRWDGFQDGVTSLLERLRADGELLDVTLCCEGLQVRAHRLVLAMCSPYFRQVLKSHPGPQLVIFLRDTRAEDLTSLLQFMYRGTVDVRQAQLASFIRTAEALQVRGLSGDEDKPPPTTPEPPSPAPSAASPRPVRVPPPTSSPLTKRRRLSGSGSGPPGSGFGSGASSSCDSPSRQPDRMTATPPVNQQSQRHPNHSQEDSFNDQREDLLSVRPSEQTVKSEQDYGSCEVNQHEDSRQWFQDGGRDQERAPLKQEPIDLTEDDEVDATLCRVAAIEAGCGSARQGQATGAGASPYMTTGQQVAVPASMTSAQTWRPHPTTSKAAAAAAAGPHQCDICGRSYKRSDTLQLHRRKHQGLTTCGRCAKSLPTRSDLRRHLVRVHCLTKEEALAEAPPMGSFASAPEVYMPAEPESGTEERARKSHLENQDGAASGRAICFTVGRRADGGGADGGVV